MPITRQDVEHVAYLARLGLTEEERETFARQLDSILDNMAILGELDTARIPPTAQVIPLQNVMRPDEPADALQAEAVLSNAPASEEQCFLIPAVFEENPADL
jgi:aspartyl-tRNA(Asn)/glutamyl-tRNA(Gln) amidotransferase subunit C